ncbi:protein FAR1-RELATED SEQUENCE 5-like [Gossypium australe]|uniref:Protein FAR1-RELATED SEQUENCE 5-like n=1 Tax=Gossypium australe TaxID=47621 RepID=A0A5B6VNC8_9ROSI|nr:protein FAR1-RELATED SEQUENCE 5-like [Gossypium australe]
MTKTDPSENIRVDLGLSESRNCQATYSSSIFRVKAADVSNGVPKEALRLRLFPYSLRDRARAWLNALLSSTVTSWNEICQKFLLRHNPPNMNAKLRNNITSFRKFEDETLYEAWERFKEKVVNASANGTLLDKSYNDTYEILERISNNDY